MKKFIAAFDGIRFSESTMQYAVYLAQQQDAQLVGVFLSEATRMSYALYETIIEQSPSGKAIVEKMDKSDEASMSISIARFESACKECKIAYTVHRDRENAIKELLHEAVFADLLVIAADETFSYVESGLPGGFIKKLLHETHCPVLVVPAKFTPVNKLGFLYDGSNSSVYAIKMFNYVMQGMKEMELSVMSAKETSSSQQLPHNKLIKEWLRVHYSQASYTVIQGGEGELVSALKHENPGILLVVGAYHRTIASMWFHSGLADTLMNEIKVPLFIAHA